MEDGEQIARKGPQTITAFQTALQNRTLGDLLRKRTVHTDTRTPEKSREDSRKNPFRFYDCTSLASTEKAVSRGLVKVSAAVSFDVDSWRFARVPLSHS